MNFKIPGFLVLLLPGLSLIATGMAAGADQNWSDQLVRLVQEHSYKPVPKTLLQSGDTDEILAYLGPGTRIVSPRRSELDFVRGFVQESSLEGPVWFHPGIAYVKIRFFGRRTASEFQKILAPISRRPVRGLLIDLRSNAGGFLATARVLIESWIPAGQTYLTLEEKGSRIQKWVSSNSMPLVIPTVLLVNAKTSSCPELFAASLQAAKKAKVVGARTFGKPTIQEAFPIDPGHVLFLTTAKVTDFDGVQPDVLVADETAQFKTALMLLRNQGIGP